MSLPAPTEHGLLLAGVHDCSIDEIERLFAPSNASWRRKELFNKLREFVREVRSTGWDASIIVDGSFVMTRVEQPNDIDLILVLPPDWDATADVRPFEYNLISHRRTRRRFGFDVYAVVARSPAERNWTTFFQGVARKWVHEFGLPSGLTKGLARIKP